jgi:hypothetical protein
MDQDKRVGMNEAIFRQVNEQIKSLDDELGVDDGTITVICECGDAVGTERIELPLEHYERIRSDSLLYVIVPGHEFPNFESVVEHAEGYDVVRKQADEAVEIAEKTDQRN